MLHEELLGAFDLFCIGPGRQHLGGLHVVVQRPGHVGVHPVALGGPAHQALVVRPLPEQAVHGVDACPLRGVHRDIPCGPVAQDVGNGLVCQRIGVVLHAGQFGIRNGVRMQSVLAHTGALAGATQRW